MAAPVKTVKLKSCDGVEFVVSESAAMQSQTIRQMIEGAGAENTIPLANVTAKTLEKVMEYCNRHADTANSTEVSSEEDLKKWDQQFLDVDLNTLYGLLMAAHNLDIHTLLDAICQILADMIKGKTVQEMRQFFNIESGYTPQEEAEIIGENSWAFY